MAQDTYEFLFTSDAVADATFTVISFNGYQAISELYRYEIEVKAAALDDLDLDSILDSDVSFVTQSKLGTEVYPVYGVLASFEEFKSDSTYRFYKAVLVPRIWKLTTYKTNEIFYAADPGQKIKVIIEEILTTKAGLGSDDYFIDIDETSMLSREYICQYNESNFDFISRLFENEGVFYYFDQSGTREKIVFINDSNYPFITPDALIFDVAAMVTTQDDIVSSLSCRKQRLPANVIVRDYNPDEPSLDVVHDADIDTNGEGSEYIYGKNVKTADEALYLAEIRAQEQACQKTQFFGESSVTRLKAGYVFSLGGHLNPDYNSLQYLIIEVSHQGSSLDMVVNSPGGLKPQYTNSFVAIPTTDAGGADVQYRPPRKTRKPRITGTLHARVDGELNSQYAQIDAEGRYKVSLPFDFQKADRSEGLASAHVRMMQPYAGADQGMQFPLLKNTEVLLSFVDGDPDRPIIAGAINNVASPGPVNSGNAFQSIIQSAAKNRVKLNDLEGAESTVIDSPVGNASITTGIPGETIILNGAALAYVELNDTWTDPGARIVVKDTSGALNPTYTSTQVTHTSIIAPGGGTTFDEAMAGIYRFVFESGTAHAIRTVIVYDPATDIDDVLQHKTGVQIRTAGIMETEALNRVGHYVGGKPVHASTKSDASEPDHIGDLLNYFGTQYEYDVDGTDVTKLTSIGGYNPTNLWKYGGTTGYTKPPGYEEIDIAMIGANIQVSSVDTFNTQTGNIYDFGGYWNYNLGNSYAEDHINQSAELNKRHAATSGSSEPVYPGSSLGNTLVMGGIATVGTCLLGAAAGRNAAIGAGIATGVYGIVVPIVVDFISHYGEVGDSDADVRDFSDVISGPGAGKIIGPGLYGKVGSSFKHAVRNLTDASKDGQLDGAEPQATRYEQDFTDNRHAGGDTDDFCPMHTDTTWVEKKFGDSYEYSQGNTLSISKGHTEEHSQGDTYEYSYGGRSEETKFNGAGIMVYHSWSESARSVEATYHPQQGALTSISYKDRQGVFVDAELNLPSTPTISFALNLAPMKTSASFNTGITADLNINFGISTSVNLGVGFATEIEAVAGWKLKMNPDDGVEFSGPGTKANKDAEFKASVMSAIVEDAKMVVKNEKLRAHAVTGVDLKDAKLGCRSGQFIYV